MDTPAAMSDYERKAWQALIGEADKDRHQSHRFEDWKRGIARRVGGVAGAARRVPGVDAAVGAFEAAVTKTMETLHTVLVERGLNSVTPASIFAIFAEQGVQVRGYNDVRRLDLAECDRSVPQRKDRYIALGVAEGAASSLAVTTAMVSTTVTAGATAAVAVSAIAADVTTVMVGMGRIVAVVAAHYGYDVREPDEEVFAAGVLAYSTASNSTEKSASLASLARLTQQMMRRTSWRHLQHQQTVNVMQRMFTALGVNLTQRKIAQAVPLVGAVVNGGINARIAQQTFDRSQHAYRLRFLTEKYHLDPARWAPQIADGAVDIPLVDELVNQELAADRRRQT